MFTCSKCPLIIIFINLNFSFLRRVGVVVDNLNYSSTVFE